METDADILIVCGVSGVVACHREILIHKSLLIKEEINNILNGTCVNLPNITTEEFILACLYMYTGEVEVAITDIPRITEVFTILKLTDFIEQVSTSFTFTWG